jgi:hypothetical protein
MLLHSPNSPDLGTKQTLRSLNSFIAPFTDPYQILPLTEIYLEPNKSTGDVALSLINTFRLPKFNSVTKNGPTGLPDKKKTIKNISSETTWKPINWKRTEYDYVDLETGLLRFIRRTNSILVTSVLSTEGTTVRRTGELEHLVEWEFARQIEVIRGNVPQHMFLQYI